MTIKDSQRSHCVKLIAELGEASGEAKRELSAKLDKLCGEATSYPFTWLRGASSEANFSAELTLHYQAKL